MRFFRRLKNALQYARLGFNMYCPCCYDELLELISFRMKQMKPYHVEPTSVHIISKQRDRRYREALELLDRLIKDDYLLDPRMDLKQKDLDRLCEIFKRDLLNWWN